MQGYYNNKEATEDAIEIDSDGVHWLHTGDLGYIDSNGLLTHLLQCQAMTSAACSDIKNTALSIIQGYLFKFRHIFISSEKISYGDFVIFEH